MRRDERGSGSLLVAAVMIVVLTMGGAALVIGGYLLAVHRARAVADLAALSGATAMVRGRDACDAARTQVGRDGPVSAVERLRDCRTVGDQTDFVVTVAVSVGVRVRLPGLPRSVTATATAGPVDLAATRGH